MTTVQIAQVVLGSWFFLRSGSGPAIDSRRCRSQVVLLLLFSDGQGYSKIKRIWVTKVTIASPQKCLMFPLFDDFIKFHNVKQCLAGSTLRGRSNYPKQPICNLHSCQFCTNMIILPYQDIWYLFIAKIAPRKTLISGFLTPDPSIAAAAASCPETQWAADEKRRART